MVNLNETDVNQLVLKLSNALFNTLNGKDDEVEGTTKFTDKEAKEIIEARKIAREIAVEKKFIPLNLAAPKSLETAPDGWILNKGYNPVEFNDVDVKFFDNTTYYNNPAKRLDWTISSSYNEADIEFWRYSTP